MTTERNTYRDKKHMERLTRAFNGRVADIVAALNKSRARKGEDELSRQTVTRWMARHGLRALAAEQRGLANVSGPRGGVKTLPCTRAQMVHVMRTSESDDEAAERLGLSRRTFYRVRTALKVTREDAKPPRRKVAV